MAEPVTPPHPIEMLDESYYVADRGYLEEKLGELEKKAKFMMQFEGAGEWYGGFLEALKEVRKILDEAERRACPDCDDFLERW